jgi:DDE superfamily endonuclease
VTRGERKRVPYENPAGRRLNVLALLLKHGAAPDLRWTTKPRSFTAEDLVAFLLGLPPRPRPLVVVLDNVGIHRSKVARAARPELWRRRIYPSYLPPYSPELNEIEPLFRAIKHTGLPERRYTTVPALEAAVNSAFRNHQDRLMTEHLHQPRPAA